MVVEVKVEVKEEVVGLDVVVDVKVDVKVVFVGLDVVVEDVLKKIGAVVNGTVEV